MADSKNNGIILYDIVNMKPKKIEAKAHQLSEQKFMNTEKSLTSNDIISSEHKKSSLSVDVDNVGYHAGDLGKSEGRANFPHTTGHFGTGTYFFGSEDLEPNYNSRNGVKAPREKINLDNYNLYRPINKSYGVNLHEALVERPSKFGGSYM